MRQAIVPITLGLGSLALMIWGGWVLFAGQRDDVATARAFLTHIAAGEHLAATGLMAPALAEQLTPTSLAHRYGRIEPWDHIGFSSRNTNGAGEMRQSELFGVGDAQSGCESMLRIMMVNGLIHSFTIAPLCEIEGEEA